jgi:hypothetical protein
VRKDGVSRVQIKAGLVDHPGILSLGWMLIEILFGQSLLVRWDVITCSQRSPSCRPSGGWRQGFPQCEVQPRLTEATDVGVFVILAPSGGGASSQAGAMTEEDDGMGTYAGNLGLADEKLGRRFALNQELSVVVHVPHVPCLRCQVVFGKRELPSALRYELTFYEPNQQHAKRADFGPIYLPMKCDCQDQTLLECDLAIVPLSRAD